jgi:predicted transcriptional regulator
MPHKPHINDALKESTLTGLVRSAAADLKVFTLNDMDGELVRRHGIVPTSFLRKIVAIFMEMKKSGELSSVVEKRAPGNQPFPRATYTYIGRKRKRTKLDIVWHLVRSARGGRVTTTEMVRLSGSARGTVVEYMACLVDLGIMRRVKPGCFQLVSDPGPETPVNTAKCKKLKAIRAKQKAKGA